MNRFPIYNPNTNSIICDLELMGFDETIKVINKASLALESWKSLLPQERSDILLKWYYLINSQREEIAQIMHSEQGKPFKEALVEVDYGNSFIKYYAEEVLRIYGEISPHFRKNQYCINISEPIGVVGAITPWNFPCAMITKKIAPALASGCSIVLKPSEETPLTAIKLRELAITAGVPEDVFGIVYGDYKEIGRAILESKQIKMISFTGSIGVGKYLMQESAKTVKKLVLELGGNAPCIILKDADLDLTVKKIMLGKFRNSGQACTAPNRIFVDKSIKDEFTNKLIKELSEAEIEIGPLINQNAKNKTIELLENALQNGAKILYQALAPQQQKSAFYFPPTVIGNLNDEMKIAKEEAFSPIFSILTFSDLEEVIDRANNTNYGLAAYLFTSNLKKALSISQELNFGVIGINETSTSADKTIHGGFNESGLGREGGKPGLLEYYENKFIVF